MVYYNLLKGNDLFSKSSNMFKWETEFGTQFTVRQWQETIHWAHKSSVCANHRKQYKKMLTRWYYTPHRIAKVLPLASPLCWKTGSLLHVCPSPRRFRDSVLSLISTLTGRPCPKGPEFALLRIGIDAILSPQQNSVLQYSSGSLLGYC